MDEKNLLEKDIIVALEELIDRTYLLNESNEQQNISTEITTVLLKLKSNPKIDKAYIDALFSKGEEITSISWFKECYLKSNKLTSFFNNLKSLKSL